MFTWSEDKNHLLKRQRGIAFEDIAVKIAQRAVVDLIYDHNPLRYPGQHLLLVLARGYLYAVPHCRYADGSMRLITIYPSGKLMRQYRLEKGMPNGLL